MTIAGTWSLWLLAFTNVPWATESCVVPTHLNVLALI